MKDSININMASGSKKNIERLISIFQALRMENFNKNKWEHRLMLQKITYIIGIRDKTLDYSFNWFVRGPYSPQLTREEYGDYRESETNELEAKDSGNVEFVRGLINKIDEHHLELLASVFYLMKEHGVRSIEEIYFRLHASKPWYSKEEVQSVFDRIIQNKILA